MKRSENETLHDELIGEAVLSLLKSKGPITTRSLVTSLQAMESVESDAVRKLALGGIITEISGIAQAQDGYDPQSRHQSKNTPFPHFGVSDPHACGKKMH